MLDKMKIAVLCGGTSAESEISLRSGSAIAKGLRRAGHKVDILKFNEPDLLKHIKMLSKYDVVFIGYHGGFGEDGRVQAILEVAGIPFTGSGSVASMLGMNKILSRNIFSNSGIPIAPAVIFPLNKKVDELIKLCRQSGIDLPVVVKPPAQGSTVGVTIANNIRQLAKGIAIASKFDTFAIVEKYIAGREMTVAILEDPNPIALPVVEIRPKGGFYDYKHKYTRGMSKYICPAQIPEKVKNELQSVAISAFEKLGCRHYARVDFRLSNDGKIYCLEVNTLPGMTDLSLVPMSASAMGITFTELVDKIARMGANTLRR